MLRLNTCCAVAVVAVATGLALFRLRNLGFAKSQGSKRLWRFQAKWKKHICHSHCRTEWHQSLSLQPCNTCKWWSLQIKNCGAILQKAKFPQKGVSLKSKQPHLALWSAQISTARSALAKMNAKPERQRIMPLISLSCYSEPPWTSWKRDRFRESSWNTNSMPFAKCLPTVVNFSHQGRKCLKNRVEFHTW